eukprot:3769895-Rhodomonas_salina.1
MLLSSLCAALATCPALRFWPLLPYASAAPSPVLTSRHVQSRRVRYPVQSPVLTLPVTQNDISGPECCQRRQRKPACGHGTICLDMPSTYAGISCHLEYSLASTADSTAPPFEELYTDPRVCPRHSHDVCI